MMLAVPIFRLPDPEYREALAADWEAAAWHEAGHAVAQLAAGLPVHRVRVAYKGRRTWRAEHWHVTARTDLTQRGGMFRKVTRDDLAVLMAGSEAEALYLKDARGLSTVEARREARDCNDARTALRFAGGSEAAVQEAADEAAVLVRLRRPAVAAVAALLCEHGTLTGEQARTAAAASVPACDDDLDAWLDAVSEIAEAGQDTGVTTEAVLDAGQAAVNVINARRGRP